VNPSFVFLGLRVGLALVGLAALGAVVEPMGGDRGVRWVMLVGPALVKKWCAVEPESVAPSRRYFSGADVVFTNLETAIAHGLAAGTVRRDAVVDKGMQKTMELAAPYLVAVFFSRSVC